jgi:DNA-directed RNA polymerase subunit alpha
MTASDWTVHGRNSEPTGLSDEEIAKLSDEEKLRAPLADLGLSVRTTNTLEEEGIFLVRELLDRRRQTLERLSNVGDKTMEEIFDRLERFGFYRKGRRRVRQVTTTDREVIERRKRFRDQYGIIQGTDEA